MAYRRRYRRRGYKRARKVLSNRNVYGKTGAKSQAKQIATLRNRVNYISRQTRPETKVLYSGASDFTFSNSSTSSVWQCYPGASPGYGPGDSQHVGDKIKIKSLIWNLTFEYFDDRPSTQSNPDSAGAMIRVIVLQWKRPVGPTIITNPENVLEVFGSTGAAYTHNAIVPLKTGLTENFSVLYDRRYPITHDKNQLMKRIVVKPKDYRYELSTGNFNNTICMILVSGLHWDSSLYTQYVKGSFSDKLVYTDP